MNGISQFRNKLERKKGQKDQILSSIKNVEEKIDQLNSSIEITEKAQVILQLVAQETQRELEYRISELVSLCLKSVFPNPYEFVVKFVIRRDKTECDLLFERNNHRSKPEDSSGVGAVDVAAFGSRTACLSLSTPKPRFILILDEPFKHLKGIEANIKVIQMVKALSKELGLQIIMVSDERVPLEEIEKGADKIFKVSMIDNFSTIKVVSK